MTIVIISVYGRFHKNNNGGGWWLAPVVLRTVARRTMMTWPAAGYYFSTDFNYVVYECSLFIC
jgi:hypothetical protein